MTFCINGIQALQHRWKKSVNCKEDYIENKPYMVTFHKKISVKIDKIDKINKLERLDILII